MIPSVLAPAIPIELGGRTRQLKMDLGAMALFEDQTGISLLNEIGAIQHPTARQLMLLTWCCLVADDPDLEDPQTGIKRVGSWIDYRNSAEVLTALTEAFAAASPEPGSVTPNGTAPKNQRRGSSS